MSDESRIKNLEKKARRESRAELSRLKIGTSKTEISVIKAAKALTVVGNATKQVRKIVEQNAKTIKRLRNKMKR